MNGVTGFQLVAACLQFLFLIASVRNRVWSMALLNVGAIVFALWQAYKWWGEKL